jgi:hypothetical protein
MVASITLTNTSIIKNNHLIESIRRKGNCRENAFCEGEKSTSAALVEALGELKTSMKIEQYG